MKVEKWAKKWQMVQNSQPLSPPKSPQPKFGSDTRFWSRIQVKNIPDKSFENLGFFDSSRAITSFIIYESCSDRSYVFQSDMLYGGTRLTETHTKENVVSRGGENVDGKTTTFGAAS